MIDTHAHVHDKAFDEDRAEVIARAKAAGVSQIVTVGCDLADSQRALEVARDFRIYASIGIHPHEAEDAPADLTAIFEPFLHDRRVVAVGETGLDYYYDHSPREVQQEVLRSQISVARTFGFPVIFHQRDAYEDFIEILREEWMPGMRGVVHCFTGDAEQARAYVDDFGLYLGIGGVITFKTAQEIRDAVSHVGIGPIVFETDCPYLAPVPHRGARNEPSFITAAVQTVADLLSLRLEDAIAESDAHARRLFNL